MRSPVEIDLRMGGSVTRLIRLVSPITILLARAGYLPLTSMLILDRTNPRLSILRISYDYWPDVIEDLSTLYLLDALHQERPDGAGSATAD